MAERRPKAKSQGTKNRLGAPNTCVSEVAARVQPVKAGSWKGINPSEAATCSSRRMPRSPSVNVVKVGGAGKSRTTAAPDSVRGAISGRQAPSVKSVKRSARALWVVKVVSLRAKCVAASGRRLTCLHTECRNGRHGGSSPVSRRFFFDSDDLTDMVIIRILSGSFCRSHQIELCNTFCDIISEQE